MQGRAALVTGGSSGIGLAIARALGEDGYAAVRGLLTRAAAEGLVPPLGPDALRFP